MTKYRIKDEAVEKAVRGLFKTQEAFETRLYEQCKQKWDTDWNRGCSTIHITIYKTESVTGHQCGVTLNKFDIEEVVEYDPKVWNDSSKVTPPKQGLYRVEWRDAQGVRRHRSACKWLGDHFEPIIVSQNGPLTAFFKSWDDEE